MIFNVALAATWLAAAYRVGMLIRQPRTIWRVSVCVAMVATAVGFTLYGYRHEIDRWHGVWNLSSLAARVTFAIGLGFVLIYLHGLRQPDVSRTRIAVYLGAPVFTSLIMIITWLIAPIHDQYRDDLLPLAGDPAVIVSCVVLWTYLAWVFAVASWTCLSRGIDVRRNDPARSISLLLIGLSAFASIPMLILWSVSMVLRDSLPGPAPKVNAIGDAILPWVLLTNGIGVVTVFAVPYLTAVITAGWQQRQLTPIWKAMISRYPEIHLEIQPHGGLLTRLQTRTERAIIEIHDALRIATIDPASTASLKEMGAALRRNPGGSVRVVAVLERVDSREDDVRQILTLAEAFRKAAS